VPGVPAAVIGAIDHDRPVRRVFGEQLCDIDIERAGNLERHRDRRCAAADPMRPRSFRECPTNANVARYPQPMSDTPGTKSAHAETPEKSSVEEKSSSKKPVPSSRWSDVSRWLTYASLVLAAIAVTLAALAYFHPAHNKASVAQQGGDAKANVCSAFASARQAVVVTTHMHSPNINDQVAELAVATNARLALIGSGSYLHERIAANSAAPADLAKAATTMANTVQQLGMNYLTNAAPDAQAPIRKDLDAEITQINQLCS
jgi:hypothetical protein